MRKVILVGTLLFVPSLVSATGFVFAAPKKPTTEAGMYATQKVSGARTQRCDPSYPTICLPPGPPDLNCSDIGFANFPVVGRDPHGFDRDRDGIGCEARMHR